MIYLRQIVRIRNKRLGYQPMHRIMIVNTVFTQTHTPIFATNTNRDYL